MNSQADMGAVASTLVQEQKIRDELFTTMGATVKELVNLLLPADYILTLLDKNAEPITGTDKVAVRRDELDSVVHMIANAHVLASKLRSIIAAAGLSGVDAAPSAEIASPPARDDASARPRGDEATARPRDDSWRKDVREALRPSKAA